LRNIDRQRSRTECKREMKRELYLFKRVTSSQSKIQEEADTDLNSSAIGSEGKGKER